MYVLLGLLFKNLGPVIQKIIETYKSKPSRSPKLGAFVFQLNRTSWLCLRFNLLFTFAEISHSYNSKKCTNQQLRDNCFVVRLWGWVTLSEDGWLWKQKIGTWVSAFRNPWAPRQLLSLKFLITANAHWELNNGLCWVIHPFFRVKSKTSF